MMLQKLKAGADVDLVAAALKNDVQLGRTNFAILRKAGTNEHYMLRGPSDARLGAPGESIELQTNCAPFAVRGNDAGLPKFTAEVLHAGRSRSHLAVAGPAIASMLCGVTAAIAGADMMFGVSGMARDLWVGASVLLAGVFSAANYVREVAPWRRDFGAAYVQTVAEAGLYATRADFGAAASQPRVEEPVALPAPVEIPALSDAILQRFSRSETLSTPVR